EEGAVSVQMGHTGIVVGIGGVKTDLRRGSGDGETCAGKSGDISLARGGNRQLSDAPIRSSVRIHARHISGPGQRATIGTDGGDKSRGRCVVPQGHRRSRLETSTTR